MHRAAWKAVIEECFQHRAYYAYVERNGEIVGVLPLIHQKSRLFGSALISIPFGVYGGPLALDTEALARLDAYAEELGERLGVDYIEYRSRTRAHPDWTSRGDLYYSFRRGIDEDLEANLKAIPRKQRAVVRQSLDRGLEAVVEGDPEDTFSVYAESVRNLGTPVFSKFYFAALKRHFGDDCEFLVVRKDGRPVSSVLSFYFRDEVLPYYGGGTIEARRTGANDYMYWSLMNRAASSGSRVFDFGRSKKGTGAFAFKKNWCFTPEPLHYEYRLRALDSVPDVNPLNPKYRLMIAVWKRLPLAVANRIGPLVVRNLG